MRQTIFSLALAVFFVAGLAGAESHEAQTEGKTEAKAEAKPEAKKGDNYAVIKVKDMGTIRIQFLPSKAPNHVENFKKLANDHFYDGTTFHRVIPGFMIQGGDPNSKDDNPRNDGTGGPGYSINAEFNDTKHMRGIVSMARSSDPNSAGSQFFIVVKDAPHLDGQYTAFGRVTSGMDVADKIAAVKRDRRDRPIENVVVESITIE